MFTIEEIDSFPSYVVRDELTHVPTLQEVRDVLSMIAGGKAGGIVVKVCSDKLLQYLVQIFGNVWESKIVPQDWGDALFVPVPKKGDLFLCGN